MSDYESVTVALVACEAQRVSAGRCRADVLAAVAAAASIQRFGRGRGINLESESFCEKRRKPTLPELEADYARFWEHALTELSKPVRRRPWPETCVCSWPTDPLPESEAAAIKEEFTIASRVRKVQVALSKAHNWPYARQLDIRSKPHFYPYVRRHGDKSICSWPTPKLDNAQAARYKMLFSRAVKLRRNAVVLSNLREHGRFGRIFAEML